MWNVCGGFGDSVSGDKVPRKKRSLGKIRINRQLEWSCRIVR